MESRDRVLYCTYTTALLIRLHLLLLLLALVQNMDIKMKFRGVSPNERMDEFDWVAWFMSDVKKGKGINVGLSWPMMMHNRDK